jgi:hypothetical protein
MVGTAGENYRARSPSVPTSLCTVVKKLPLVAQAETDTAGQPLVAMNSTISYYDFPVREEMSDV